MASLAGSQEDLLEVLALMEGFVDVRLTDFVKKDDLASSLYPVTSALDVEVVLVGPAVFEETPNGRKSLRLVQDDPIPLTICVLHKMDPLLPVKKDFARIVSEALHEQRVRGHAGSEQVPAAMKRTLEEVTNNTDQTRSVRI